MQWLFVAKRPEFAFGWGVLFENERRDFRRHKEVSSDAFVNIIEGLEGFLVMSKVGVGQFPNRAYAVGTRD